MKWEVVYRQLIEWFGNSSFLSFELHPLRIINIWEQFDILFSKIMLLLKKRIVLSQNSAW